MSNEIKSILNWFEQAKPSPTTEDACVQIGCHYEEVCEMSVALVDDDAFEGVMVRSEELKSKAQYHIEWLDELGGRNRVELLDALCDQIVTAIGVAHMLKMDITGALHEVSGSNWSKFEDGKPVFDENGKIKKGKGYFKPNLDKFV